MRDSTTWLSVLGATLLLPIPFVSLTDGGPSLLAPLPLIPLALGVVGASRTVIAVTAALAFWIWSQTAAGEGGGVPRRSWQVLGAMSAISAIWFASFWRDGVAVQGVCYLAGVTRYNLGTVGLLCAIGLLGKDRRTPFRRLGFHWILVAWVCWCAFPYLGPHP